jgi:hypothetical protein
MAFDGLNINARNENMEEYRLCKPSLLCYIVARYVIFYLLMPYEFGFCFFLFYKSIRYLSCIVEVHY